MQTRRLALLATGVIAAAIACSDAVAAPVTLAAPAQGRIHAFTQDGRRIAWIGYRQRVHIKTLSTGRSAIVGRALRQGGGDGPTGLRLDLLALAGKRAVWTSLAGGNCIEMAVFTATLGDGTPPAFVEDVQFCSVEGNVITAVAGDAATLAFTHVGFEFDAVTSCSRVNIGRAALVVERSAVTVPGSVPAVRLAVSAGRVALVPADVTCLRDPVLAPAPNATVEVRAAIDGALLATFSPVGTVRALGLAGPRAVVLVEAADGSKQVERYDATTGAFLGATPVSPLVANVLDTAAGWIVYRTGRAIRLMDAVTGAKQLLVTARAIPLGLSIESRRVAWAENRLRHGRVRSVLAPAHS